MFKAKLVGILLAVLSLLLALFGSLAAPVGNVSAGPAFVAYPQITQQDENLIKKQAYDATVIAAIPAGKVVMVLKPRACVNANLGLKCLNWAYVQYADESIGRIYYGYIPWAALGSLAPTPTP